MVPDSHDILLIEDSEADRVLIGAMLSEPAARAWDVEARKTLGDGLQVLKSPESASRFAAVLLDLSLPDSHGLETFTAVRQVVSWMPIVVLTGNEDTTAALAAMHQGAQDYLFKNSLTGDLLRKSLLYAIERKCLERTWRAELEQRVRERTAELSAANEILQREIAERRRAEEALQENRRFVEQITNATPSIVFILDVHSRSVVYANEQLQAILGLPLDEVRLLDEVIANRLHLDDLHKLVQTSSALLLMQDDEITEVEARVQHADGSWRWLHARIVIFRRSPDGKVRLVLGSAFDITDRRNAEDAARHQQEQLIRASRITVLSELASSLAVELIRPEAEGHEVIVQADLTDGLPQVKADRKQLRQVLRNLIRNGIDFKHNTPLDERSLNIETIRNDGESVGVSVSDGGEGCDSNDVEQLLNAIREALQQTPEQPMPVDRSATTRHKINRLSQREREILAELIAGKSIKQIATQLGTSPNTVRNQRGSILEKMAAKSLTDLVRMVVEDRTSL